MIQSAIPAHYLVEKRLCFDLRHTYNKGPLCQKNYLFILQVICSMLGCNSRQFSV